MNKKVVTPYPLQDRESSPGKKTLTLSHHYKLSIRMSDLISDQELSMIQQKFEGINTQKYKIETLK